MSTRAERVGRSADGDRAAGSGAADTRADRARSRTGETDAAADRARSRTGETDAAADRARSRAGETDAAAEPLLRLDGSRSTQHRVMAVVRVGALSGPALALMGLAVGWPLVDLVRASLGHYASLWHLPALAPAALRTGIWVAAVVPATLLLSLALAQLVAVCFPLRRAARTVLVLPLAASATVTAVVFRWALDPRAGVINVVLHGLGLVRLGSPDASWLTRPGWDLVSLIVVGIFVSVPLTTYMLLAGLRAVPPALRDAARLDGPAPWRRLWSVTLPSLRRALGAAALIDLVAAFNALPIVWEMTRGGPGDRTQILMSFMFSLRGSSPGVSAALSVADLVLLTLAVVAFLRVTRPREAGWTRPEMRSETPRRLTRGRSAAASLAAGLVALAFLLPYLEMIVAALRPADQMFAANLLPTHFTLANFSAAWRTGVGHSLLRSLAIAVGATVIVMVSAVAAALHGARQPAGRRSLVLVLAVTTQLLGPVVLLDGLAQASSRVGLPSTVSLVVIDAAFNLGFAIWILERAFRAVPAGLREAAMLDDLTPAGRLARVRLIPSAGAVVTALVFTFVSAWDELSVALTLTGHGTRGPLTVAINDQLGQVSVPWGPALAACVIAALPPIVMLAIIERRLAPGEPEPIPA